MRLLATVAGVVLLIAAGAGFATVVIVAFPGTSMDADTQGGAALVLVLALLAATAADVLLIAGLRQPAPRRRARPMRYRKRTTQAALVLSSPLIVLVLLVAWAVTRLRRAPGGSAPAAPAATTADEGSAGSAEGADLPGIAAVLDRSLPLRWEAAFMATLIDLAVRGHVELAERSGLLRCRAPGAAPPAPPAVFERLLLDHVARRLAAGDAPVQALLPDHRDVGGNLWFRGFESAVLDEAYRRGLARGPRSRPILWPFVSEAASRGTDPAVVRRWLEMRDTLRSGPGGPRFPESGAAVDDPRLAWAIALGAADDVLAKLLPPAPWSAFGGSWHLVPVPRSSRGSVAGWRLRRQPPDQRRTFVARVIRRWTRVVATEYDTSIHRFVAVDDGRAEEAIVFRVGADQFKRTRWDGDVLVTVDRKGRLVDLVPIDQPSAVPQTDP